MKIVLTCKALTQIENLYNFYNTFSEKIAIKITREIFDRIETLKKFPTLGKKEPLLENKGKEYRALSIFKGKIKIIYYVEQNYIYISTLWDCRQNPKSLIKSIK